MEFKFDNYLFIKNREGRERTFPPIFATFQPKIEFDEPQTNMQIIFKLGKQGG